MEASTLDSAQPDLGRGRHMRFEICSSEYFKTMTPLMTPLPRGLACSRSVVTLVFFCACANQLAEVQL